MKLGLPKGSLQEATFEKLAKAGYNVKVSSRSYLPYIDDEEMEIRLIRAQEVSRYVEHGYLDCGITGHDWVIENGSKVHEKKRVPVQQSDTSGSQMGSSRSGEFAHSQTCRSSGQAHCYGGCSNHQKIPSQHKVKANVEFSWGATESKAHELVDAIVEITETGNSLRANKLRIVDTLLTSTPRLIVNQASWKQKWKREKIETFALLLRGALDAESKVGLKLNILEKKLSKLLQSLPALRNPTVSSLALPGWVAVETVIDEQIVREIIPQLKAAGAEGIIEYPLNKIVY